MADEHEHNYMHQGMIYVDSNRERPGSGAVYRYYAHVYYCRACTAKKYDPIDGEHSSYEKPLYGALPGSAADKTALLDQERRFLRRFP